MEIWTNQRRELAFIFLFLLAGCDQMLHVPCHHGLYFKPGVRINPSSLKSPLSKHFITATRKATTIEASEVRAFFCFRLHLTLFIRVGTQGHAHARQVLCHWDPGQQCTDLSLHNMRSTLHATGRGVIAQYPWRGKAKNISGLAARLQEHKPDSVLSALCVHWSKAEKGKRCEDGGLQWSRLPANWGWAVYLLLNKGYHRRELGDFFLFCFYN